MLQVDMEIRTVAACCDRPGKPVNPWGLCKPQEETRDH